MALGLSLCAPPAHLSAGDICTHVAAPCQLPVCDVAGLQLKGRNGMLSMTASLKLALPHNVLHCAPHQWHLTWPMASRQ